MRQNRSIQAEIISIGDELNRGEIVDTNAAWLGARLLELGILVHFRQGMDDEPEAVKNALLLAISRSNLVLVTGGLGPTEDDVTVDSVAELLGIPVIQEPYHLQKWQQRYKSLNPSPVSLRQVRIPQGATVLTNSQGAAPGFQVDLQQVPCFFFPGVPREMKPMFQEQVVPRLAALAQGTNTSARRTYRVFGLGESEVSQRLDGWLSEQEKTLKQVTLHYRLSFPEVLVIVVASEASLGEAEKYLEQIDLQMKERLGEFLYAKGDDGLPAVVGGKLARRGEAVVTAESCTGGLVGELLTSVAGSSAYYLGGVVAYHNDLKRELLGVSEQTLQIHGAVSGPCVTEMAEHIRLMQKATYGIAISGVAGPEGGTKDKPVGTVYIALATPEMTQVRNFFWVGDREQIRVRAAYTALNMLDRHLSLSRST